MKQMTLKTVVIGASTFACAALLSFGWSEQRGVSLSVESAQARVGRPLTPVSVAGVARRHNRRAAYGYGYGAGVAGAAAVGTAAAVASSPYNGGWGSSNWSNSYAAADPHYGQPFYAYRAYHGVSPYYGYAGWNDYASRSAIRCAPGSTVKLDDGQTYMCQ
jgi:hypothetical protein